MLEKLTATTTLNIDIVDHTFAETFVVMKNLTGHTEGLHFMRHHNVFIDTTYGLVHFLCLKMQVKSASSGRSAKHQVVLIHEIKRIPTITTKTITAFVDCSSEWNTTATVTPVEKVTKAANLTKAYSISTIIDKKIAVRVTNTTESPYSIKKHTQTADFSVVTPKQSKFLEPVDTPLLNMIPEGDPDLTT